MKKLTAFVLAAIMVLSMFTVISADTQKIEATFIKVGETRDYKDIQSAIDAAKAIDGTVVIDLDEGDYNLTDTIKIEDADGIVIRGNGCFGEAFRPWYYRPRQYEGNRLRCRRD